MASRQYEKMFNEQEKKIKKMSSQSGGNKTLDTGFYMKRLKNNYDKRMYTTYDLLFKKAVTDKQKAMNYQHEYDRIRGILGKKYYA